MDYETARRFLEEMDRGRYGTSLEDRASALAMVLAGAVAGTKAALEPSFPPGTFELERESCEFHYGSTTCPCAETKALQARR